MLKNTGKENCQSYAGEAQLGKEWTKGCQVWWQLKTWTQAAAHGSRLRSELPQGLSWFEYSLCHPLLHTAHVYVLLYWVQTDATTKTFPSEMHSDTFRKGNISARDLMAPGSFLNRTGLETLQPTLMPAKGLCSAPSLPTETGGRGEGGVEGDVGEVKGSGAEEQDYQHGQRAGCPPHSPTLPPQRRHNQV